MIKTVFRIYICWFFTRRKMIEIDLDAYRVSLDEDLALQVSNVLCSLIIKTYNDVFSFHS